MNDDDFEDMPLTRAALGLTSVPGSPRRRLRDAMFVGAMMASPVAFGWGALIGWIIGRGQH